MLVQLKALSLAYINLESYPNRNKTMVSMLNAFGLDYFRVEGETLADYDPIALSHMKALKLGADLVLEDDCMPLYYRDEFEVPDDSDVVFLGISTGTTKTNTPKYEKVSEDIYRLYDMTSAHAILYVTEIGKDWLRESYEKTVKEKTGFDLNTAKLMPSVKVYGLNRPLWYQRDVESQTMLTLDEALLSDQYSGGGFDDYPRNLFRGL